MDRRDVEMSSKSLRKIVSLEQEIESRRLNRSWEGIERVLQGSKATRTLELGMTFCVGNNHVLNCICIHFELYAHLFSFPLLFCFGCLSFRFLLPSSFFRRYPVTFHNVCTIYCFYACGNIQFPPFSIGFFHHSIECTHARPQTFHRSRQALSTIQTSFFSAGSRPAQRYLRTLTNRLQFFS